MLLPRFSPAVESHLRFVLLTCHFLPTTLCRDSILRIVLLHDLLPICATICLVCLTLPFTLLRRFLPYYLQVVITCCGRYHRVTRFVHAHVTRCHLPRVDRLPYSTPWVVSVADCYCTAVTAPFYQHAIFAATLRTLTFRCVLLSVGCCVLFFHQTNSSARICVQVQNRHNSCHATIKHCDYKLVMQFFRDHFISVFRIILYRFRSPLRAGVIESPDINDTAYWNKHISEQTTKLFITIFTFISCFIVPQASRGYQPSSCVYHTLPFVRFWIDIKFCAAAVASLRLHNCFCDAPQITVHDSGARPFLHFVSLDPPPCACSTIRAILADSIRLFSATSRWNNGGRT